jgi:hypothetical protein
VEHEGAPRFMVVDRQKVLSGPLYIPMLTVVPVTEVVAGA